MKTNGYFFFNPRLRLMVSSPE